MENRIIETNETPKKESWEKTLSVLEWSALVMFILFLLLYFSKGILSLWGVELKHPVFLHETWGVFGDFIGGVLGTFIAYISVRLLVKTLYHQIAANKETSQINEETATVYKLQQFNEQFNILFNLYQNALNAYETSEINGGTDLSSIVKQFREHGNTSVKNDSYDKRQQIALDIFKDFYVTYHNIASVHFRLLYRIFQLIDDADIPNKNKTDIAKIIPPPLNTIVECELRSLGLSMILHLSAILKYTNSAMINITAIIPYVQIMILRFLILETLQSPLQPSPRIHWHFVNAESFLDFSI